MHCDNEFEKINNLVLQYCDTSNTDYALMLNGSWGSGKTWYVQNVLIEFLRNNFQTDKICNTELKDIVYLSLFSLKDIDEAYSAIMLQAAGNALQDKSEEAYKNATGKSIVKRSFMDITGYCKLPKVLNTLCEIVDATDTAKKVTEIFAKNVVDCKRYFYIIDDFERSRINDSDLLGFIDYLADQQHCKVLLLCNEKALLNKSNVPAKQEVKEVENKEEQTRVSRLMVEQWIEPVATDSYPDNYLAFKEKMIGRTIEFKGGMSQCYDSFVECFIDEDQRSIIKDLKENVLAVYHVLGCQNLRTLKYAMQIFANVMRILKSADNISSSDEYWAKIISDFFMSINISAIAYKDLHFNFKYKDETDPYIDVDVAQIAHVTLNKEVVEICRSEFRIFNVLDSYIKGAYSENKDLVYIVSLFKEDLRENNYELDSKINSCWGVGEKDAISILQGVIAHLEADAYNINCYPRILGNLFEICDVLENNDYKQDIKNYMKKNCLNHISDYKRYGWSGYLRTNHEANNFIIELEKIFKSEKATALENRIKDTFKETDIEKFISSYELLVRENNGVFIKSAKFISNADLDDILKKLATMNNSVLQNFIGWTKAFYNMEQSLPRCYIGDLDYMVQIVKWIDDVVKDENIDKIKKYHLNEFASFLNGVHKTISEYKKE